MKIIRKLLTLTLIGASICLGQNGSSSELRKVTNGRPAKIIYYKSAADAPSESSVYFQGSYIAQVALSKRGFGETFTIPTGNIKLNLLANPLENTDKVDENAPVVSVPATWDKVLFLVFEDKKNEVMPIKIKAIDASEDKFGNGSLYMLNFTKFTVIGTMGEKEVILKPLSEQILKDPISGYGTYPVSLDLKVSKTTKPRRFVRQPWSKSSNKRSVLFVFPQGNYASYYAAPIRNF